ncbi:MAG: hypothetical protein WC755_05040 [Candidatus Woesearchaeota archaeon]|jgi:hypothetical protein
MGVDAKLRIVGFVLEQYDKILIECRDEYGRLCPSSTSLPFISTQSSKDDVGLLKKHIKDEYGVNVLEIVPFYQFRFKTCEDVCASYYYVKVDGVIKGNSLTKKWMNSNEFLKEATGVNAKAVDAFLKSKIEVY